MPGAGGHQGGQFHLWHRAPGRHRLGLHHPRLRARALARRRRRPSSIRPNITGSAPPRRKRAWRRCGRPPPGCAACRTPPREEVVFGGTSLATDTGLFPTILNRLIGTRFKVIVGYKSSTDVDLAMERGEVQGKIWTWGSLKSGNTADWVEDEEGLAAGAVRSAESQGLARSAAGARLRQDARGPPGHGIDLLADRARLSFVHGPGRPARAGRDHAPRVRQDDARSRVHRPDEAAEPGARSGHRRGRAGDRANGSIRCPHR